jgi:uncharacterized protein YaiI (UPF0178 family)
MSDPAAGPRIWVDADALPVAMRDILFRAALRTGVALTLVANQPIRTPSARHIRSLQVAQGYDVADSEILRRCAPGDLVITADIPLAAEVVDKGAAVFTPRGEALTTENIRQRLNLRDFMESMRSSGIQSGGPAPLDARDRQNFAKRLDRWLGGMTRPGS